MSAACNTKLTVEEFNRIAAERMPFAALMGLRAESISFECAVVRAVHRDEFLRPGGSIAGPIMMGLADAAFYAVILGNLGAVELAVTTNFSIHFLRKPPPGDIIARASLLKLGKRLAVCEATLRSQALPAGHVVAHATGTYSIPQSDTEKHRKNNE
ncbi:MAG: PaaI family thioesterase [Gammaproteobacteria bacterium]